jgi:hypothetical protein
MAQYRVLQTSFINNALVQEGEVVEFDGEPGSNLEPLKKSKKGASAPVDGGSDEQPQEQEVK